MKRSLDDLALFGGLPEFATPLHVGRPNVGDRESFLSRVEDMLERHYLTNGGPYELELERRIAGLVGVDHCVAICNATIAIEILIRAAGLEGEVIVPSLTFVATAHALEWLGLRPVFCDVSSSDYTIDPGLVEHLITPRTTGIIGVHLWGRPCDVEALTSIARRRKLRLFFDAAHALACSRRGTMVGSFGDAEVFSFHATKFVNSFEGGAIVTNDAALAERARLMRNFGFAGYDNVVSVGTNGKMTEVAAAMGLTSLESIDQVIARNRENHRLYAEGLANVDGIKLLRYDDTERSNYQYVVAEMEHETGPLRRDDLIALLHAENVVARRYFYPGVHRMEPYASRPETPTLPVTERAAARVVVLPTGTGVDGEDIRRVCQLIEWCLANGESIRSRLP